MTWYTRPIDPASIRKNASYPHHYRSRIDYTLVVRWCENESGSYRTPFNYYVTNEESTHNPWIYNNTDTTFTGYVPVDSTKYVMYLYTDKKLYTTSQSYDDYFKLINFDIYYTYGSKAVPVGNSGFSGGFLNPAKDNSISFGINHIDGIDTQYSVASGVFYYKKTTDQSYQQIAFSGSSVTIPAGTLQTGNSYDSYAVLTCDDGTTCNVSLSQISTVDGTPSASVSQPNNTVVYGETEFRWNYYVDTGAEQYAYDIQISSDNGSTWTTVFNHVVSPSTVSAVHTGITAGDYLWRVKVYNQDDVASSWSAAGSFICNVPPDPPVIISISGNGRKTVQWSASGQTAYHVQVVSEDTGKLVYDSGDVYSASTLHFINEYLPDGNYTVKVKVINVYGKESAYATMAFTQNTQLADPDFTAVYSPDLGGVQVIVDSQSYVVCYLKRNGVLIAKFTGDNFIDYFVNGRAEYTLIAVDANDCFGISTVVVTAVVPTSRLIRKNGEYFDIHVRWGGRFEASQVENTRYEANEYLGASVPEHSFSKMRVMSFQVSFDDTFGASSILGEVLFYADIFGNGYWVVPVTRSRADHWFGNETVLQLELTDGKEEIAYEL